MKPIRNRVYCTDCKGTKMLFSSEKKAMNFIHFNADKIMEETGKAPVRCYYCESYAGWHVTSNLNVEYFIKGEMEKEIKNATRFGASKRRLKNTMMHLNDILYLIK